jgi:hypothetical protein
MGLLHSLICQRKKKIKLANKPDIKNDITHGDGIMKKSMVIHDSCGRINSQPK